jgi:acetate kinase
MSRLMELAAAAHPRPFMRILAINCGSSSIKCAVVETPSGARSFDLRGVRSGRTPQAMIEATIDDLRHQWQELGRLDAVVHRVVHGGELFLAPSLIDEHMLSRLRTLDHLAPLHNPPAIHAIERARAAFPHIPHVAVFDTAFHASLPAVAREYALPAELRRRHGFRRFGFHGINHAHVARLAAAHSGETCASRRLISCHLGSGASIAAVLDGRSMDTSMGMTPLEGLIMGTRAGDLDPGIVLELSRHHEPEALATLLNGHCGLSGLTGTDDWREIERRASEGDDDCRLAMGMFVARVRKYIGAYAAVLQGIDALVFTGGIGENSATLRRRCLEGLEFLGVVADDAANHQARPSVDRPVIDLTGAGSRVRILVIRADEEQAMARDAAALLEAKVASGLRIPIAVSARHAHLSQATIDRLFGPGHTLRVRSALSQSGQFSAEETVRLIGPRGSIDHVRLMGPPRARDQVEISRSDEFTLGLDAPVRLSGDLTATPGITLEGPRGRVEVDSGVICARRHIHLNPAEARRLGLRDRDTVAVRIDSNGRDVIFGDISVRVSAEFSLELHLDTDEANAAEVRTGDYAELLPPRTGESTGQ